MKQQQKKQQKKQIPQAKWQFWLVALGIVIIAGLMLAENSWVKHNYLRLSVEHTINHELKPLKESLEAVGFTDLGNLDTKCMDQPNPSSLGSAQDKNTTMTDCSATVNRFVHVPADTATFNMHAVELSQALQANGWKSREDLPTIPWFQKISQGVDYQADQLNTKTIGDTACTIDFFTAFAKPAAPALSLMASCDKHKQ